MAGALPLCPVGRGGRGWVPVVHFSRPKGWGDALLSSICGETQNQKFARQDLEGREGSGLEIPVCLLRRRLLNQLCRMTTQEGPGEPKQSAERIP